jgi:chromosome segregation protein
MLQFEEDRAERERAIQQTQSQLDEAHQRRSETERAVLTSTSQVALLYLDREALAREAEQFAARQREIADRRTALGEEVQRQRKALRALDEQQNQKKLAAGEIRHQRSTLADRLREDYGIELAALEHQPTDQEQHEREAVEEEIASLRRKLANIGAVNMEALDELEELETRFASLSSQHKDLSDAKQALERIIHKINADSRRLFSETLEAIRANFQVLYRKVFGGGRADIVLEEGVDVLDAGVEIISNPPGKPAFSNSLLSGGEKALTALALLLAIFQHQPSPFCVLDEVDAPWDESNIGRFIDVLKEFLSWTRFVIVTHSKKTMTAATTLYGVTMQESGVSKRVSVRFEDVSDDGHIADEALSRDEQEDAA